MSNQPQTPITPDIALDALYKASRQLSLSADNHDHLRNLFFVANEALIKKTSLENRVGEFQKEVAGLQSRNVELVKANEKLLLDYFPAPALFDGLPGSEGAKVHAPDCTCSACRPDLDTSRPNPLE